MEKQGQEGKTETENYGTLQTLYYGSVQNNHSFSLTSSKVLQISSSFSWEDTELLVTILLLVCK